MKIDELTNRTRYKYSILDNEIFLLHENIFSLQRKDVMQYVVLYFNYVALSAKRITNNVATLNYCKFVQYEK